MSTVSEIIDSMQARFNAEAANDMDEVFQFDLEDANSWHLVVKNGTCEMIDGVHDDPSVTLIMDTTTMQAIISGKMDGMQAFMTGKLRAEGNMMLATRLQSLFPL